LSFPCSGRFCYTLGVIFDQVHRHMAVALLLLLENAFVISLINQVYTFTLDNYAIMYSPCSVEDHGRPQHFIQNSYPPKCNNSACNLMYLLSK
jgi:hypothetical protein